MGGPLWEDLYGRTSNGLCSPLSDLYRRTSVGGPPTVCVLSCLISKGEPLMNCALSYLHGRTSNGLCSLLSYLISTGGLLVVCVCILHVYLINPGGPPRVCILFYLIYRRTSTCPCLSLMCSKRTSNGPLGVLPLNRTGLKREAWTVVVFLALF